MQYNFTSFKNKVKEIEDWLKKEQSQIRTGRASPTLLDSVRVESYGSHVPLNQVGAIAIEDARSIRIAPWDMSQAKEIEKAIVASNLGVSVAIDDKGLRVSFPELTSETRQSIVKLAKEKLEQAKITLRNEREKIWNDIQAKEKSAELTEDEKFRSKNDLQKIVDETNKKLDDLHTKKEKEIVG
jgi:ribosome recycling factor